MTTCEGKTMDFTAKHTIEPKKAASYRLHAARWGVERIARKMAKEGYSLVVALEVLVGRNPAGVM